MAVHEVERGLWGRVLRLGREALGLYFSLQGEGDVGEIVTLVRSKPLVPAGMSALTAAA